MTDKAKFIQAIRRLRMIGYEDLDYGDTPSKLPKMVMLHDYPSEIFDDKGKIKSETYLGWIGDADEILEVLHSCNIDAQWSGKNGDAIVMFEDFNLEPQKRMGGGR